MSKITCLYWGIFLGLIFSDIGGTQSRREINNFSPEKKITKVNSQQPWFPYMTTNSRSMSGSDNLQDYLIGDTLLTQPPPDSVEIIITNSQGDYEKIWLAHQYFPDWKPGVVLYGGRILIEENDSSIPDDGILQVNSREAGYKKIAYRSFNDQRLYTCRLEWSRVFFEDDK